jgi:hypothetical protein
VGIFDAFVAKYSVPRADAVQAMVRTVFLTTCLPSSDDDPLGFAVSLNGEGPLETVDARVAAGLKHLGVTAEELLTALESLGERPDTVRSFASDRLFGLRSGWYSEWLDRRVSSWALNTYDATASSVYERVIIEAPARLRIPRGMSRILQGLSPFYREPAFSPMLDRPLYRADLCIAAEIIEELHGVATAEMAKMKRSGHIYNRDYTVDESDLAEAQAFIAEHGLTKTFNTDMRDVRTQRLAMPHGRAVYLNWVIPRCLVAYGKAQETAAWYPALAPNTPTSMSYVDHVRPVVGDYLLDHFRRNGGGKLSLRTWETALRETGNYSYALAVDTAPTFSDKGARSLVRVLEWLNNHTGHRYGSDGWKYEDGHFVYSGYNAQDYRFRLGKSRADLGYFVEPTTCRRFWELWIEHCIEHQKQGRTTDDILNTALMSTRAMASGLVLPGNALS